MLLCDQQVAASQAAHAYNDQPYYVGQQVYGTDPDNNLLISFGYYPDLTKVRPQSAL